MIGTDQYDSVSKAVRITADWYVSEPAPEKRVGAVSEKRKKKKTPLGHPSPMSLTGISVRHVLDTGTLPKMACQCNLEKK